MMMYQLPMDMMTRMASVTLATMSLPFSSAVKPYGLSTTSVAFAAAFGAAAAGAAAGSAGAAAAAAGAGCACPACGTTAADTAMSRTAASAARRVIFSMLSPDRGLVSEKVARGPADSRDANGNAGFHNRGRTGRLLANPGSPGTGGRC